MTIRSGGRPRDRRGAQARPFDPDAYATETVPEFAEPAPRGRRGGGRGRSGRLVLSLGIVRRGAPCRSDLLPP